MPTSPKSAGAAISALDLADALDAAEEGISLFDEDGKFLYVNREFARLFGYDAPSDLLGRSWELIYPAEWRARFRTEILPDLMQHRGWRGVIHGRQRDGSGWGGDVMLTYLRAGRVLAVCRRDAGVPKVSPTQAAGGVKFIAKLSHEFRTPLATMQGVFYLLQRDLGGAPDDKRQRWLLLLQDAMGKLRQLADEVSELNRVETAAQSAAVPLELRPFLASLVNARAGTADEVRLSFSCAANAPESVHVNEVLLRSVIDQFISNALKYSAAEARVQIIAASADGRVRIVVKDEGRGVPAAELGRLWQPFFRASNAAPATGTGLGLVLAARAAELMGASVGCQTEQDKGSDFWVEFAP